MIGYIWDALATRLLGLLLMTLPLVIRGGHVPPKALRIYCTEYKFSAALPFNGTTVQEHCTTEGVANMYNNVVRQMVQRKGSFELTSLVVNAAG